MLYAELITLVGRSIDTFGVIVIFIGLILSTLHFLTVWFKTQELDTSFFQLRQNLARTIILGLEFLIAGDIIRSIAVPPTFTSVGTLGIIVLIRSFLAMQMEKDFSWHFPFSKKHKED